MADKVPNARPVIVFDPARLQQDEDRRRRRHLIPAWILSGVIHALLIAAFLLITGAPSEGTVEPPDPGLPIEPLPVDPPETPPIDGEPPLPLFNPPIEEPEPSSISMPGGPGELPDLPPALPPGNFPPLDGKVGPGNGGANDLNPGGDNGSIISGSGPLGGKPLGPLGHLGGPGGRKNEAWRNQQLRDRGGDKRTEDAVGAGLAWLAKHQAPDGRWSFNHFHQDGKCQCSGQSNHDDVAATAFGLLPFLGRGETHKVGADTGHQYAKTVEQGLKFLLSRQNPQTGEFHSLMYSHALATIAVCEAYQMTSDPQLRKPAQMALNYIVNAQSPQGGWRYEQKQPGFDTSVGGWQVMALKSGQMAGLNVPTKNLKLCHAWLDAAANGNGGYGYCGKEGSHATTAAGLLCRQYLGWKQKQPELVAGVKLLDLWGPAQNDMYYNYYATQVMHHMGGRVWDKWNVKMRDHLLAKQSQNGHEKGSWHGLGGHTAGRIMETSMAILTLEVYYRHLPLYRRDVGGDKALD